MKTALEQLIEHLDPIHSGIKEKAIKLLEVEKEQIENAFNSGYFNSYAETNSILSESMLINDSNTYYHKTYTNE